MFFFSRTFFENTWLHVLPWFTSLIAIYNNLQWRFRLNTSRPRQDGRHSLRILDCTCCHGLHPWLQYIIICSGVSGLIHRGRDKMAAIYQTFSSAFSWMKNIWMSIKISLTFVSKGPINNIPALGQIMAWRRRGDKPIIWTNGGQFTDAYIRHPASMS